MRKVVFGINASLDGFFGHEDMNADEDLHQYFTEILKESSQILYGRTTYELMVPFWPDVAKNQSMSKVSNEFATVFSSLEKILFSTTLKNVDDQNTTLASRSLRDEVTHLKKQIGKDICVGSLSIASQLSNLGLIDEYRIVVHPVIVGKGPRLFSNHPLEKSLRLDLISTKTFPSGNVAHHYLTRRN
ncbi:dihydrofolate reductase family protein [Leptospira sp. WS39.C2]